MLSSTIGELASLRDQVGDAIERSGAAIAWRFETHAVASGTPPDEQYLGIAATCDLYVLIIASQQSDATEAEYRAAYEDNPEKVLAFFLGDGGQGVAHFRALIESRHTRVSRDSVEKLVDPIVRGIVEAVTTGRTIRPVLLEDIDRRLERARSAIADVPLLLEPQVIADGAVHPATDVLGPERHVALTGIGGSGKTMTALVAARRAARDGRMLPVYVVATEECADPTELMRRRLEAVRFRASDELLERWGSEGRIMLIVDGMEGLSAPTRRRFMGGLASWAERYPRSGMVVCARGFAAMELPGLVHVSSAPLGRDQMSQLTQALGLGGMELHLSAQVRDIARWPMWATALLVYGPEASSGLELLQRLVHARLQTAGMSSPVEAAELRAAAASLAYQLWPATSTTAPTALERVREWSNDQATRDRFSTRPAEDVLHRLGEAALLEVGDEVSFPHRLIATVLAAEHVTTESEATAAVDQELIPFVAALLDDDRHVERLLQLVAAHDVFALARYLRLSPARDRSVEIGADVQRLSTAYRSWSRLEEELDVVFGDRWLAWRPASRRSVRHCDANEYDGWRSESAQDIEFWPSMPFKQHSPEFVAAIYVLSRFRNRVLDLDPGGDAEGTMPAKESAALLRDHARLSTVVLDVLSRRRQARQDLLSEMGMADSAALRPDEGEPHVRIWRTSGRGEPLVSISWGAQTPSVEIVTEPSTPIEGWTSLLAPVLKGHPRAAALQELRRDIENALGCRLGAQTWSRPELVPAWAW